MPRRIPVRPVHDSALGVPLVLTGKFNGRSRAQPVNSRRQVVVVSNEQRLAGRKANDEALVPRTLRVVFQYLCNDTTAAHFNPALVIAISRGESIPITFLPQACRFCGLGRRARLEDSMLQSQRVNDAQQADEGDYFPHW